MMAILAILAGLAIPGLARLGVFSRQELPRATREIYTMLRAAQIYAATFRVDTAVVYGLDNWVSPDINPGNEPWTPAATWAWQPYQDSLTAQTVRAVRSAAIMYKLPASEPCQRYVPIPDDAGAFEQLPTGMVLLLQDINTLEPYYASARPRYAPSPDDGVNNLDRLGMSSIQAFLDSGPVTDDVCNDSLNWAHFPAHVFTPEGRLAGGSSAERYILRIGPRPDETLARRLVVPDLGTAYDPVAQDTNIVHRAIEVFRSTGRIRGLE